MLVRDLGAGDFNLAMLDVENLISLLTNSSPALRMQLEVAFFNDLIADP